MKRTLTPEQAKECEIDLTGRKVEIEKSIQKELHYKLNAVMEESAEYGKVDLSTNEIIIEVKKGRNWKDGIGQLIAYSMSKKHRGKRKILHLFEYVRPEKLKYIEQCCSEVEILLVYQGPVVKVEHDDSVHCPEPPKKKVKQVRQKKQKTKNHPDEKSKFITQHFRRKYLRIENETLNEADFVQRMMATELISLDVYNYLKNKDTKSKEQQNEMEKFLIHRVFRVPKELMTPEFFKIWGYHKNKSSQFLHFVKYFCSGGNFEVVDEDIGIVTPDSFWSKMLVVEELMKLLDIQWGKNFKILYGTKLSLDQVNYIETNKSALNILLKNKNYETKTKLVKELVLVISSVFGDILHQVKDSNYLTCEWKIDNYLKFIEFRNDPKGSMGNWKQ
jgi:hypothetical protein